VIIVKQMSKLVRVCGKDGVNPRVVDDDSFILVGGTYSYTFEKLKEFPTFWLTKYITNMGWVNPKGYPIYGSPTVYEYIHNYITHGIKPSLTHIAKQMGYTPEDTLKIINGYGFGLEICSP